MLRSSASVNYKKNKRFYEALESPVFSRVFSISVFSEIVVKSTELCNDLADGTNRMVERKQGFHAEQERIFEKWQVPRKYYEMIEDLSYTKDEGYFIYLKKGYVNDVTGSRNIHCMKTSEVRRIIGKIRKQ